MPLSERANFRNSEIHVPQFGDIKRRNSPLLSSRNFSDVILPSAVVNEISGIISRSFVTGWLLLEQANNVAVETKNSVVTAIYIWKVLIVKILSLCMVVPFIK